MSKGTEHDSYESYEWLIYYFVMRVGGDVLKERCSRADYKKANHCSSCLMRTIAKLPITLVNEANKSRKIQMFVIHLFFRGFVSNFSGPFRVLFSHAHIFSIKLKVNLIECPVQSRRQIKGD